jgi:hypothetical protein
MRPSTFETLSREEFDVTTERQLRKAVELIVGTMKRYHDAHRLPGSRSMMAAEVLMISGWIMESGLSPPEVDQRILNPVGNELLEHYGYEVGPRLYAEFLKTFEDCFVTEPQARRPHVLERINSHQV